MPSASNNLNKHSEWGSSFTVKEQTQLSLNQIQTVIENHLANAQVQKTKWSEFRLAVDHIKCVDGTVFSIQAGAHLYCIPRNNHGPWTHVEVMTVTENTEPKFWIHDCSYVAGMVPIELVALEIANRGGIAGFLKS